MVGIVVILAHVRLAGRPATLCTLRAVTGIPCPFCGGTTAAVRLGSGDPLEALRASPLAVLVAPVVVVLPMLQDRLSRVPRAWRYAAVGVALVGSELWQLHRFGWI